MQLVDELSMIYTTCIMVYASFSYSRSTRFSVFLGIGLLALAGFITVYYHITKDPLFHQNSYAILTATVCNTRRCSGRDHQELTAGTFVCTGPLQEHVHHGEAAPPQPQHQEPGKGAQDPPTDVADGGDRSLRLLDWVPDLEPGQRLLRDGAALEATDGASLGHGAGGPCLVASDDWTW